MKLDDLRKQCASNAQTCKGKLNTAEFEFDASSPAFVQIMENPELKAVFLSALKIARLKESARIWAQILEDLDPDMLTF